jgi:hypothetical protein
MKTIDGSTKIRFIILTILLVIILVSCYIYHFYHTYNSIKVVAIDTPTVEYGSANYDINDLIKKVDGKIVSIKKDIDTSIVGEQEIIIEVKKENITREIPIIINVVDTSLPVISLKENTITINDGEEYNLNDNIEYVNDLVDGYLSYLDDVNEDSLNYYSFSYDDDLSTVGSHEITVTAKDNAGNTSEMIFTLEVKPTYKTVYRNLSANQYSSSLVSIAYSLIGYPYISGGNGPYGFDCSGFVQYVYAQVGVSVSRSATTQIYDGYAVSYEDAKPGDILSWGYSDGVPTHSALYIGNGQMIHATNPTQGVILSDVASWTRGSGTSVISVRRIL